MQLTVKKTEAALPELDPSFEEIELTINPLIFDNDFVYSAGISVKTLHPFPILCSVKTETTYQAPAACTSPSVLTCKNRHESRNFITQ